MANILPILFLFSSLASAKGCCRWSDSTSSAVCEWSSSSSDNNCRSKHRRKHRGCHGFWYSNPSGRDISEFRQIEFILGTIDAANTVAVKESFRNTELKTDAAVNSTFDTLKIDIDALKDDLYKDVISCTERNLRDGVNGVVESMNYELTDFATQIKNVVDAVNNEIVALYNTLANASDSDLLLAIRTPTSVHRLAVTTAVLSINESSKQIIQKFKGDIRKEAPTIITRVSHKEVECINESFKKFTNAVAAKLRTTQELFKKQLDDILKTAENSLIATLCCISKRIIDAIKYLLCACTNGLFGGRPRSETQCILPLFIPEGGANPVVN